MTGTSDTGPTTLQTVERALQFLEYIATASRPPKIREVADALGLNITTSYHLVNTLRLSGYVVRASDGSLRIGGKVAILHQGHLRHFVAERDLRLAAEELGFATGETVYLSSLIGDQLIVQVAIEATHAVRVSGLRVGYGGSEHLRASGKAVLAFLTDREPILRRSLRAASPQEQLQIKATLDVELAEIVRRGWALDKEEFQAGVCCIAAPYFQSDGTVAGSVGVSMPAERFAKADGAVIEPVLAAARSVSELLGAPAPTLKPSALDDATTKSGS